MISLEPVSAQILKDVILTCIKDYFQINEIDNYHLSKVGIPHNPHRFRFMRLSYARDASIVLFQSFSIDEIREAIYKEMDDLIFCMKDRMIIKEINWSDYIISIAIGNEINRLKIRTRQGDHPLRFIIMATRKTTYLTRGRNSVRIGNSN